MIARLDLDLLLSNEAFVVEVDRARSVVVATRSAVRFRSRDHVNEVCEPVQEELDALGRHRYGILVDVRSAPPPSSAEYESWFASHRQRLVERHPRAAVLMRTAVGKLQMTRLREQDSTAPLQIFGDEVHAVEFVLGATWSS